MGSNLQSNDMVPEMKESLLKMFGTLKQTVIWKFEGDLGNVPKNVHLVKWAPQQSILGKKKNKSMSRPLSASYFYFVLSGRSLWYIYLLLEEKEVR